MKVRSRNPVACGRPLMPEPYLLKFLHPEGKHMWLGCCGLTDRLRSARRFNMDYQAIEVQDRCVEAGLAVYPVKESEAFGDEAVWAKRRGR
jgi:hypothetical protein